MIGRTFVITCREVGGYSMNSEFYIVQMLTQKGCLESENMSRAHKCSKATYANKMSHCFVNNQMDITVDRLSTSLFSGNMIVQSVNTCYCPLASMMIIFEPIDVFDSN